MNERTEEIANELRALIEEKTQLLYQVEMSLRRQEYWCVAKDATRLNEIEEIMIGLKAEAIIIKEQADA